MPLVELARYEEQQPVQNVKQKIIILTVAPDSKHLSFGEQSLEEWKGLTRILT